MRLGKFILTAVSTVLVFNMFSASVVVNAETIPVCETDVSTGSDGNVIIGVEGYYVEGKQSAIDLINTYRLEACQNGYNGYTMADYVPIQWSDDLEYIARIRATESSITMSHQRTTGKSCFNIQSPDGERAWGEVLAWNWSESMLAGIKQWYGEKEDFLNNTGGETGHYTQMIDPDNKYVGIGTFICDLTQYYNTTCGEFSSTTSGSSYGFDYGNVVQKIEVRGDDSEISLSDSNDCIVYNQSKELSLSVSYLGSSAVTLQDKVAWSTSDSDIISINGNTAYAKNYGTATLTAKVGGLTKKFKFTVIDQLIGDVNGDSKIDSKDSVVILKAYASSIVGTKNELDSSIADVNEDGSIDSKDAVKILKYYASSLVGEVPASIKDFS